MQVIFSLISIIHDLKDKTTLCSSMGIGVLSSVNNNPINYNRCLGLCEKILVREFKP